MVKVKYKNCGELIGWVGVFGFSYVILVICLFNGSYISFLICIIDIIILFIL